MIAHPRSRDHSGTPGRIQRPPFEQISPEEIQMIETFLLRRLDLPPTVRQQSAMRIADHISAKLQASEEQKRDLENFLELVVRQFRKSAHYR